MSARLIGGLTVIATGVAVGALGVYFKNLGDGSATTQATILGALAQVAGVAATLYGIWLTLRTPSAPAPSGRVEQHFHNSTVNNSTVIGSVGSYQEGRDDQTPR